MGLAVVLAAAAVWWVLPEGGRAPEPVPLPLPFGDAGVFGTTPEPDELRADVVMNLLVTGLVAGRRRLPVAMFVGQLAAVVLVDFTMTLPCLAAILVGAYSLAVHGRTTRLAAGVLVGVSAAVALAELDSWLRLPGWAGAFVLLLPGGLAGLAVRSARARARASEERTSALHREREAVAELAVVQERARIARELHDVVSHHVSMMTIQAGAAGAVLDDDPARARGALSAIEASGRETMTELRHLLGVLAAGDGGDAGAAPRDVAGEDLEPQPGLERLDALVRRVRQTGQPVTLLHEHEHEHEHGLAVPHGAGLTAYRVVQEALTNALRYAPGAVVQVAVRTEPPGVLVVEVINDEPPATPDGVSREEPARRAAGFPGGEPGGRPDAGPGGRPVGGSGNGSGLIGLSERLRLYGGTLETGRRLGGGFRVRALIPLAADGAP